MTVNDIIARANGISPWLGRVVAWSIVFVKRFSDHMWLASSLAFSTILAIVPIAALLLAVGQGFGLSVYIEDWIADVLSSQPQVADYVLQLAKNNLQTAKGGTIIGVGVITMIVTVVMLIRNIELSFNKIWDVTEERSMDKVVTSYVSMVFVAPILIILVSGINIFIYGFFNKLQTYEMLAPFVKVLVFLMPLFIMMLTFMIMFKALPNTNVRLRSTVVPSILASVGMWVLQTFYVYAQSGLTHYNAIYGSLAVLPLFMMWMLFMWYVILFCVELCFTIQNRSNIISRDVTVSHKQRLVLSAVVLKTIFERFAREEREPATALLLGEYVQEQTGVPPDITSRLLNDLCKAHLISEHTAPSGEGDNYYLPAIDDSKLSFGEIIKRMESVQEDDKMVDFCRSHATPFAQELLDSFERSYNEYLKSLNTVMVVDTQQETSEK